MVALPLTGTYTGPQGSEVSELRAVLLQDLALVPPLQKMHINQTLSINFDSDQPSRARVQSGAIEALMPLYASKVSLHTIRLRFGMMIHK